jgi:hypothetical protein
MTSRRQFFLQAAAVPYLDKRGEPQRPGEAAAGELPGGLNDVPLGFFGPEDVNHPQGGAIYMGVRLAVQDANRVLPAGAKPFRLAARWSDDPWRAGAAAVVKLVYTDQALAVIGGIDGATTHLAAQVAAKALVPVLDPVSTDESTNQAGVPWIFSWAPPDADLAGWLTRSIGGRRWSLLASTRHDDRHLAAALLKAAPPPAARVDFAQPDLGAVETALEPKPGVAVLLAAAEATARLAPALAARAQVLTGPAGRSRACAAARLQAPPLCRPDPDLLARLEQRFQARPDSFSVLAYQATAELARAIRSAGASRAAVRDALAARFPANGRRRASEDFILENSSL